MGRKIDDLIKALTIEEKIGMIHGDGLFKTKGVPRLGIPPFKMADGPMGVRQEFTNDKWETLNLSDDYVTYLPSGRAIASSWNKDLSYQYGYVLGEEARGRGKDMILAPSINIDRSPLCGRNFEYLSEDPYLTARMAVPMVKGIQSRDVSCCVKHFAANNQETDRLKVDVIIDQKPLHEIYLKAFRDVVHYGDAYALMGAYNKINGEHCSQSETLLNKVLRDEWGFKNMVVSDWFAVNNTDLAAKSGIDVEMSVTPNFDDYFMANPLLEKVKSGEIDEALVDLKVKNILTVMDKLHMLDDKDIRNKGSYNKRQHQEITYEIAKETICLLKNEHILPIKEIPKKVLVIGDNAVKLQSNEGGSAEIKALYEITPLMALKMKLGGNTQVDFVKGYYIHDPKTEQAENWQESSLETKQDEREQFSKSVLDQRKKLKEEAVSLAKDYDQVFFFGGLNHTYDLEGQDRSHMDLPFGQDDLIDALLDVRPDMVIHMLSGSAVKMPWVDKANALLWSSYNGMEGGHALVDIIFGDVNPSAKLTTTFAEKLEDYPSHSIGEFPGTDKVRYAEGMDVGYRHFMKQNIKPIFPFGYGLSYASFAYEDLNIDTCSETFSITFQLKNESDVDGKEIVELYVIHEDDPHQVPILKAFKKIFVHKHDQEEVVLTLYKKELNFFNEETRTYDIKKGKYKVIIAKSIVDQVLFGEIEV